MTLSVVAVIGGLILLTISADRFVLGAASIARLLGAPPLLIGITVVGIGTSAPEILVSLSASLRGAPNLAVGNAVGSNITNIALVLGLTALITPLAVSSGILKRELPLVLMVSLIALWFCFDLTLSRVEGVVLLCGFVAMLCWMLYMAKTGAKDDPMLSELSEHENDPPLPKAQAWAWVVFGFIMLPASAQLLVYGASDIARNFGISDLVIGLTIVAIGTSLPELAASLASALRKEGDLALGNILGSNLFNLLLVLAIPGVIASPALDPDILMRDLPVMLGLTAAAFVMAIGWRGEGRISRIEGAALLAAFIGYELILAMDTNLL
ncbi:MAG: calcium/sodium antiporter [Oceanococcus sp.]